MSIINKRQSVKKTDMDTKLKSKLRENFDWMKEDDELALDGGEDTDLDAGLDGGGEDLGMGDAGLDAGTDAPPSGGMEGLTEPQIQTLDSEVDQLLQLDLDAALQGGDGLGDDALAEDEFDGMDVETPSADIAPAADLGTEGGESAVEVTPMINTTELENIIDAPNSLGALEDELVGKVTDDAVPGAETDPMLENEDPFKGIDDLPGFEQGYEGEDVKDELTEDVDLTKELKSLEFGEEESPLGDNVKQTVGDGGVRGGADSNVDEVNKGNGKVPTPTNIAPADVMSESIKKSKMLVKAAAAILKLKQMQEAAQKEAAKLKFENAKLYKLNALLAVAGDKMTKDVRKKMVESFVKCKTQKDVDSLYGKVVNVIKEHSKPSLNKAVKETKTQVKTATVIKEAAGNKDVKVEVSHQQKRKNHLMGLDNGDSYYDF